MKIATLVIFLLSHQGYWLSNQAETISLQWSAAGKMPQADVIWELKIGELPLTGGKAPMRDDDKLTTIDIKVPQVRVRTAVKFAYRVIQREGNKELEHGEIPLSFFPADLTRGWAGLFRDKQLVVIDSPDKLPKLLEGAHVPFTRVDDASRIDKADVILVGEDQLDDSTFGQAAVLTFAEQGKSVMIFRQSKPSQLAGYALVDRPTPAKLVWKLDHPLFDRMTEADVQSWLGPDSSLRVVQLTADEPALELASWPRETPGKQPAPIDAVVVTKTTGAGRIVLWELPMGDWQSDPRSQMLLGNALAYLLSPPQATLKPSEREIPKALDAKETKKPETNLTGAKE